LFQLVSNRIDSRRRQQRGAKSCRQPDDMILLNWRRQAWR
jgi:hypothetical protein